MQAARAAEQCDAEGWLLQQGSHDAAAQYELTEAANIATLAFEGPRESAEGVHDIPFEGIYAHAAFLESVEDFCKWCSFRH